MIKRLSRIACAVICLFSIYSDAAAISEEKLVGVFPFSNQRVTSKSDWIGYYIQARIEKNLKYNSDWIFHSLRTLHFWKNSLSISPSEKFPNTIIISGSYQQVADIGVASIIAQRERDGVLDGRRFNIKYTESDFLLKVDAVSFEIGRWIDPGFKPGKNGFDAFMTEEDTEELYTLISQTYQPSGFPETRLVLAMMDVITPENDPDTIARLAEGMLILSVRLNQAEQKSIFAKTESLLKKATLKYNKNSELYGLLAETYFLNNSYGAWIEKTAKEALSFDARNDLASLLILLVADLEKGEVIREIERLNEINPLLWSGILDNPELFQKKLLASDLYGLGKRLNKF